MKYALSIATTIMICVTTCLVGCASSPKGEVIDKLIINNRTGADMNNVALRVPATGLLIGCSNILKDREFSLGFPERQNRHNPAVLEWKQNGRPYSRRIVNREELHSATSSEQPFVVIVDVIKGGYLKIRLEAENLAK